MNGTGHAPERLFMGCGLTKFGPRCRCGRSLCLVILLAAFLSCRDLYGQTASTGALTGITLDPSGAVLPQVSVHLTRLDGTVAMAESSDENGWFGFFLLPPGPYEVQASKVDFKPLS